MKSLAEWLCGGEARLKSGPHPWKARLDSESLLLHSIARNRAWLLANKDAGLSAGEERAYTAALEERVNGKPIQYIHQSAEFYGLPFRVTPAVLIPRPETELLVEQTIARAAQRSRILDVGTGSGCIAIALAKRLSGAAITATDISAEALEVARFNAAQNHAAGDIRFLHGDLLAAAAGETFDIVVSNPPYVPVLDRDTLAAEVRDHEPAIALFAGADGLEIFRWLIPAARASLVPGGELLLEIGCGQKTAVEQLLKYSGFEAIEGYPDLQGIPRVVCARRAAT